MKNLISFSSCDAPFQHAKKTSEGPISLGIYHFRRQIYSVLRRDTPNIKTIVQHMTSWAQRLLQKEGYLAEEKEEEDEVPYYLAPETLVRRFSI